jgi:hypothetical protein
MPNNVRQPITNVAEEICYKRNYLTQVIVRVDFLNSPPGFDKQLPQELITAVSKPFPIPEPKTTIAKEFQISPSGIKETLNKQIQE